jgi:hypothetical protein
VGLPRIGAPVRIAQVPGKVILMYNARWYLDIKNDKGETDTWMRQGQGFASTPR